MKPLRETTMAGGGWRRLCGGQVGVCRYVEGLPATDGTFTSAAHAPKEGSLAAEGCLPSSEVCKYLPSVMLCRRECACISGRRMRVADTMLRTALLRHRCIAYEGHCKQHRHDRLSKASRHQATCADGHKPCDLTGSRNRGKHGKTGCCRRASYGFDIANEAKAQATVTVTTRAKAKSQSQSKIQSQSPSQNQSQRQGQS